MAIPVCAKPKPCGTTVCIRSSCCCCAKKDCCDVLHTLQVTYQGTVGITPPPVVPPPTEGDFYLELVNMGNVWEFVGGAWHLIRVGLAPLYFYDTVNKLLYGSSTNIVVYPDGHIVIDRDTCKTYYFSGGFLIPTIV